MISKFYGARLAMFNNDQAAHSRIGAQNAVDVFEWHYLGPSRSIAEITPAMDGPAAIIVERSLRQSSSNCAIFGRRMERQGRQKRRPPSPGVATPCPVVTAAIKSVVYPTWSTFGGHAEGA